MKTKNNMKTILSFLYLITLSGGPVFSQTTNSIVKNKNYSVEIIRYNISQDEKATFEEAYLKAGAVLKNSSYCLGYEIIRGVDEKQHYIVRIHWTSVDDHLNGFRKSKEFSSFFALVKPFYNNIEEMKHYELTGSEWNR
jgi:quinol monooxygenase YgiN